MSAAVAQGVAGEVIAALGPACERIEIAGSLRRGLLVVNDVELIAVSKSEQAPGGLLFESDERIYALDAAVAQYIASGAVEHLAGRERYVKMKHWTGAQIDLFVIRPPAQFGLIKLIRTGPAAYSQAFVTDIRRAGFHAKDGALHVGAAGCGSWECATVVTPEEIDVYAAVGFPYVEPERRT